MKEPLTIHIELALLSDAVALRQLSEQTFFDTYAEFNTQENMQLHIDTYFDLNKIQQELVNKQLQYVLVKQDTDLIGFAKLVKNHPKKGLEGANPVEIERFYIQKAYKGQRLGSTLMQACVDWAKKEGFDTLWLGVWEYNPKAINFYEKMGFHRFGTHTFTLGSDIQLDFLMKRTLK